MLKYKSAIMRCSWKIGYYSTFNGKSWLIYSLISALNMDISHLSAFGKKGFFLPFIAPSDFSGINYLLTPLMYIMSKPHITTGSKASKERTRSVITKDARRVSFWLLFWKGIFNRKSPIKGAMGKKGYCWTLMWHWLAWLFLFRLALMDVWSLLSSLQPPFEFQYLLVVNKHPRFLDEM